jgi:hypothetical protein
MIGHRGEASQRENEASNPRRPDHRGGCGPNMGVMDYGLQTPIRQNREATESAAPPGRGVGSTAIPAAAFSRAAWK